MSSDGDSVSREDRGGRKDFKTERIGGGTYEGPVDDGFAKFLRNLVKERDALDIDQFPSIHRLIQAELEKASKGSYGGYSQEQIFIDLYNDPPITLQAKAQPPSRLFPKFNYAGRIIGPKGSYLKALMKETTAKMVLLGKGVMKDKDKEEELRRGNDPKYIHLNEDMHVSIQVTASASEAYKRMAYAISCLKEQVLSDNRTLESLPWITSANNFGGGGGGGGGRPDRYSNNQPHQQQQRSYQPPPENSMSMSSMSMRSHRNSAPSYDYGEPASPVQYRRYPHEMSPPPQRRSEPMKTTTYGEQWRSIDHPRGGGGGGGEYVDRRGSSNSNMRSRSPGPPPSSRSYSSVPYEDPYASYYGSTDTSYYTSADNGSYGAMPSSRGGKMSNTRYAPYKK